MPIACAGGELGVLSTCGHRRFWDWVAMARGNVQSWGRLVPAPCHQGCLEALGMVGMVGQEGCCIWHHASHLVGK